MKYKASIIAAVVVAQVGFVFAQPPDFSGTWRLDASRSRISETAALAGLIAAGAPDTLHVTHAANGTLVVESQFNESHARIYKPDGESSTPVFMGQVGSITMTSRWEGRILVSEGVLESTPGATTTAIEVKEVLGLSSDGRTLEIEVTTTNAGGQSSSKLMYTRIGDVGPCESWPSPCKSPSR